MTVKVERRMRMWPTQKILLGKKVTIEEAMYVMEFSGNMTLSDVDEENRDNGKKKEG